MKQLILSAILLLGCASSSIGATPDSKVHTILEAIQDSIRATHTLSYQAIYLNVNPTVEDSIYSCEGHVWLIRVPYDSIFGCRFHLSGKDNRESFEYFYDGQTSYEIRRDTITTFNPYKYPNTPDNPAKARMALLPFVSFLIDSDFAQTLTTNLTGATLTTGKSERVLTLNYAQDKYGMIETKRFYLGLDQRNIREFQSDVIFRGMTFKTRIQIDSLQRNHEVNEADIALPGKYAGYPVVKTEAMTPETPVGKDTLVGLEAPDFSYDDLSGHPVSLGGLKGKVVLLDFWESWCGGCLLAFPKVNELQEKYGKDGLVIIGVTVENPNQIRKLAKANGLEYRNVLASPGVLKNYDVYARPTYVLIDREGIIEQVSLGDLDTIKRKIAELINK